MRKITQESINAFINGVPFNKANTTVLANGKTVVLQLHGNPIAKYAVGKFNSTLEVSDGGWQSNTTKERLNGIPNVHIQQKRGVWHLNGNEWGGEWAKVKN